MCRNVVVQSGSLQIDSVEIFLLLCVKLCKLGVWKCFSCCLSECVQTESVDFLGGREGGGGDCWS